MFFNSEARKYKEMADVLRVEKSILEAELALYREIASISDKEAVIVVDQNKKPIFFNTRANMIADKEGVVS